MKLLRLMFALLPGSLLLAVENSMPDRVSARPELTITTLGFGSCARQERPQPIWDRIIDAKCDAFVLCGDNIYGDSADPLVLRQKYATFAAMPGFAKLRASTPLFATWDDHDYGSNDDGAGFVGAAAAQREFCDFFQVPATSPLRSTPGVYNCVTFGPEGKRVQLILLDTRSFRSPLKKDPVNGKANIANMDAGVTILGDAQWEWLERRLREPAEIRVVVTSIQFISAEHPFEKWQNFPKEYDRFLALLHKTQAKGVVIVSGDRHIAEFSLLKPADGAPYPLYDMTTSGLNLTKPLKPVIKPETAKPLPENYVDEKNPSEPKPIVEVKPEEPKPPVEKKLSPPPPNRFRTHERPYTRANFGLMRVKWDGPHPELRLEICGLDGELILVQDIPFSSFSPSEKTAEPAK
jgi:alkaline phosphatase D